MRLLPRTPEGSWLPYVWLVYSGFFLLGPVLGRGTAREWTLTIAGFLAFLVLYFAGYWLQGSRVLWAAGGILLLGVVFIPVNPGASCFFIYAAAFLGYAVKPRAAMVCLGILLAILGLEIWLLGLPPWAWVPAAVFSLVIGGVNIHQAEVSRANARLRLSQDEVERLAKTAERERIAFARSGYLRRALDAGAAGYLLKDSPAAHLAEAVRRVHAGLRSIDPELAAAAWDEADPLTDRERQVLRLAAEGHTGARIAAELHLSEGTVRNYLSEAISKLGAENRVEAARIARQKGWL